MKKTLSKIIRNKNFYPIWKKLNKLSLYGMNYGVASGYADYSGELSIINYVKKNLKSEAVIFDVGANIGDWSKFIINEYKEINYQLHIFEPSLNAFEKLKQNILKSDNTFFYNLGFGDVKGDVEIHYDSEAQGSASVFNKDSKFSEKINIDTIDTFCANNQIDRIDFLKMDVQGYEYNILLGAIKLLKNNKIQFIQFEFDEPNVENRIFFKDFWELLSEKYDIYHSLYNGLVRIEKYNYGMENFLCMNYLAILKEGK